MNGPKNLWIAKRAEARMLALISVRDKHVGVFRQEEIDALDDAINDYRKLFQTSTDTWVSDVVSKLGIHG
jgi:hypothetical protein